MMENRVVVPGSWLYAIACIVFPVAWGLLMVAVVQGMERLAPRRRRNTSPTSRDDTSLVASPDYYI